MMRAILFIILPLAMVWQNSSASESYHWYDNTQLLPQYCKDRAKGGQSPEFSKWRSTFGDVYIHVHHYCAGLYYEQKANSALNKRERGAWLAKVANAMRYVSGPCKRGCVLYPELHTRWGWALGEQGQAAEAIQHFRLAFQAKPKYSPAYARLSELYIEINQPEEARKALEAGLKANPNSGMLKRRLKELGSSE